MSPADALQCFEDLQKILVLQVSGAQSDNVLYKRLRLESIADPQTKSLVPEFLNSCRDLDQVGHFLGQRFKNDWEAQRRFVWEQFRPAFDALESRSVSSLTDGGGSATPTCEASAVAGAENEAPQAAATRIANDETRMVFIGHGRSPVWRTLKDFIGDRLHLQWDEFNRASTAGIATVDRLRTLLDEATFAFLIMTAEDEMADGKLRARENVVHEIGLFQGRLGVQKAIILLEEGCSEFSNIAGLTYISFPKGRIEACFEEVRRVLEREGLLRS